MRKRGKDAEDEEQVMEDDWDVRIRSGTWEPDKERGGARRSRGRASERDSRRARTGASHA